MKIILSVFCFLCLSCNSQSESTSFNENSGRIVAIKDGDTFTVLIKSKEFTIRLAHIDCPEKNQPFGKRAKQYASDLCFAREVQLIGDGKTDRYGRIIAEVYIGNTCVNKALVKAGLAWHFLKYSDSREYDALEREARLHKRGLWAEPSPIAPWDWRAARRR